MSSKITKKRFKLCKDKADKVCALLTEKKQQCDVAEFLNTIKFASIVLEDFSKTKDKERPVVADEGSKVEQLLKEYEELLNQIVESGRFVRFFTSNRVKKKLDLLNSQLFREISAVHTGLQATKKKSTKKGKEDLETFTDSIVDPDGRDLWLTNFGQAIMVEWKDFVATLGKTLSIDDESNKMLQYILDNSNTNYVSVFKFADFLTGFGPLKQCVTKVHAVLKSDWFHGFLSSVEAERLLERQPVGTYLIRFSKSRSGSFAIGYVDANNRSNVTHTLITSCPPSGFKIEEQYHHNARGRLFVSLNEVVEFYGYILQTPFRSDLAKQSWFHGDLSSAEAEEILRSEKEGTFLFRFSSKPGFLAVSYVLPGASVKHGVLEVVPGGYKYDNNPPIYPTLHDVVTNLKDLLKQPYTGLTFDVGKKQLIGTISKGTLTGNLGLSSSTSALGGSDSNYASFSGILRTSGTPTGSPTVPAKAPAGPPKPSPAPPAVDTAPSNYSFIPGRQPTTTAAPAATPSPSSPGLYGKMPGQNQPQPPANQPAANPAPGSMGLYGKMPNQGGTAPPPATGSSPTATTGGVGLYGKMPTGSGNPAPVAQYGSFQMPGANGAIGNPSNNQYGKMPNQPAPAEPQQYGAFTMPTGQPATGNPSSGLYGKMPNAPANGTKAPEPQQYGAFTMPTGQPATGNPSSGQYGKMPNAPAPVAAPTEQYGSFQMPTGTAPANPSSNQYGKMPNALPKNEPPSNYGSFSLPTGAPPGNSNASSGQYGKMPNQLPPPGSPNTARRTMMGIPPTTGTSQYGSISTLGLQNPGAMPPPTNAPPSQYGSLASIHGISSPTGAPPSQYGSLASIHSNMNGMPPPTNAPPSQYGSISNLNLGGQPGNYQMPPPYSMSGGVPPPREQPPTKGVQQYGMLSSVRRTNSGPVNQYGALSLVKPMEGASLNDGISDDYGALPNPVTSSDDYGALPPTHSTPQHSNGTGFNEDYGALPPTNSIESNPGYDPSDYGALPATGQDQDYGALPSTSNEDYGALPSTEDQQVDYGALPNTDMPAIPPKPSFLANNRFNSQQRLSGHRSPVKN